MPPLPHPPDLVACVRLTRKVLAELGRKAGAVANEWEKKQYLVDKLMETMAVLYSEEGVSG